MSSARSVGVLGTEGGAEGVHVAKGHRKVLGIELAGDRKGRRHAKEVLAPVDIPLGKGAARSRGLLGRHERRVRRVNGGHAEHLARTLAVARGDDGGVDIDKAALLEKRVDRGGRHATHAEDRAEEVRARTQVLLGAQELDGGALLLQRIVRRRGALHADGLRRELKGLLRLGRELDRARADERSRDVLVRDLVVVGERIAIHDDLQVAEAAAVVDGDKPKVLHVADGLDPSGNGDALAAERLGIRVELRDLGAIHMIPFRAHHAGDVVRTP